MSTAHSFATLFATYRDAWLAALLIALACSIVAVYVVLRRVAFIGIATAQIAAAGVALAFLLGIAPLPLAATATFLGVVLFSVGREPIRVTREALVGVAFALASALAVLFVFRSSRELDHIEHIVYGSLLFATPRHVLSLAAGALGVVAAHVAFAKEFVLVSVDPDTATTLGVRTRFFQGLLAATIGVVIALSIGTAGSLLTFAFLVLPALTALLLAERIGAVFVWSVVSALVAAGGGLATAVLLDLPPGPTIVVASSLLLACAALARVRSWLGIAALAAALLGIGVLASSRVAPQHAATHAPLPAADSLRVEIEAEVSPRRARAGTLLTIEFHGHVHDHVAGAGGDAPVDDPVDDPVSGLHVLFELGSNVAAAALPPGGASARVVIDTTGLAPGSHPLVVSAWTGPPLDPTDRTRLLGPDELTVNAPSVEIEP